MKKITSPTDAKLQTFNNLSDSFQHICKVLANANKGKTSTASGYEY